MSEPTTSNEYSSPVQDGRCGRHRCGDGAHSCRPKHCFGKLLAVLLIFGLGFFSGKSFSCEPGLGHGGMSAFMAGKPIDIERMDAFAEHRVKHLLDEVKASDEQKVKAAEIVKAALNKGAPLAEKMRDNHDQLHKLMTATTLDKSAIESVRAEQIRLADEASRLATQAMQDVAELLTAEQRAKLAGMMEHHHGWMHQS